MKLLLKLLKVDMINSLALTQYRSTKKYKAKSKSPLYQTALTLIIMFIVMGFYSFFFAKGAHAEGKDSFIIILGLTFGTLQVLILTLGKSYATLFRGKDYEFLASMPIPTKTIVASKICSMILTNYIYFGIGFIPAFIIYFIFAGFSFNMFLLGIIFFAFGPYVPTILCTVIGFIIGSIFEKLKIKNALTILMYMLLMVVVFFLTFSMEMNIIDSGDSTNAFGPIIIRLESILPRIYFMFDFAMKAMSGSTLYVLWYVLCSVLPTILVVLLIAKFFVRINSNGQTTHKNKNFGLEGELKKVRRGSALLALYKKEMKTIFGIPSYCINVIVGPFLSIVLVVVLSVTYSGIEGLTASLVIPILLIMSIFSLTMIPSTSTSISIEGKRFWILKTSPIAAEKIFISKLLAYLSICIVPIIADIVIMVVMWELSLIQIILWFLTSVFEVIAMGSLGLWVNTIKYRFDWVNPVQAVKSGTETLFSMLLSFLLDALLAVPTFVFLTLFPEPILVTSVMSLLILAISLTLLFVNGKTRFNKIEG